MFVEGRTRTTTRTRRVYVALKKSEAGVIDTKGSTQLFAVIVVVVVVVAAAADRE